MQKTTEVQAGDRVRVYTPTETNAVKVTLTGSGRAVMSYSGMSSSVRVSAEPWDAIIMVTDHIDVKNQGDSIITVLVSDELQESS